MKETIEDRIVKLRRELRKIKSLVVELEKTHDRLKGRPIVSIVTTIRGAGVQPAQEAKQKLITIFPRLGEIKALDFMINDLEATVSDAVLIERINEELLGKGGFRNFLEELENLLDLLEETQRKNPGTEFVLRALEAIERGAQFLATIKTIVT